MMAMATNAARAAASAPESSARLRRGGSTPHTRPAQAEARARIPAFQPPMSAAMITTSRYQAPAKNSRGVSNTERTAVTASAPRTAMA